MSSLPDPLVGAYAACEAVARSHYENFPVASRLLPKRMRPHVAAVYAFARTADDMADEGSASAGERLAQLGAWQKRLHAAVAFEPSVARPAHLTIERSPDRTVDPGHDPADPIIVALAHSIRTLDLPLTLFDDLISAFGQDTMTTRYASWGDVLDYCRRSANPIGRLVLRIGGYQDAALDQSSDALCTALQLTNFWQDMGRDWRAGRLYVPRDLQHACGANEASLSETDLNSAPLNAEWVRAIEGCVALTRKAFAEGRAVCDGVRGRLRFELRVTWLGGARILTRVEEAGALLPRQRPTLGVKDVPRLAWGAATWSAGGGGARA